MVAVPEVFTEPDGDEEALGSVAETLTSRAESIGTTLGAYERSTTTAIEALPSRRAQQLYYVGKATSMFRNGADAANAASTALSGYPEVPFSPDMLIPPDGSAIPLDVLEAMNDVGLWPGVPYRAPEDPEDDFNAWEYLPNGSDEIAQMRKIWRYFLPILRNDSPKTLSLFRYLQDRHRANTGQPGLPVDMFYTEAAEKSPDSL